MLKLCLKKIWHNNSEETWYVRIMPTKQAVLSDFDYLIEWRYVQFIAGTPS